MSDIVLRDGSGLSVRFGADGQLLEFELDVAFFLDLSRFYHAHRTMKRVWSSSTSHETSRT